MVDTMIADKDEDVNMCYEVTRDCLRQIVRLLLAERYADRQEVW